MSSSPRGPQAVREAVAFRPDLVRDVYVTAEAAERHAAIVAAAARRATAGSTR